MNLAEYYNDVYIFKLRLCTAPMIKLDVIITVFNHGSCNNQYLVCPSVIIIIYFIPCDVYYNSLVDAIISSVYSIDKLNIYCINQWLQYQQITLSGIFKWYKKLF